jgi:hypothetical protein
MTIQQIDNFRAIEQQKLMLQIIGDMLDDKDNRVVTHQHYAEELDRTFVDIQIIAPDDTPIAEFSDWYCGRPEKSYEDYLKESHATMFNNLWVLE